MVQCHPFFLLILLNTCTSAHDTICQNTLTFGESCNVDDWEMWCSYLDLNVLIRRRKKRVRRCSDKRKTSCVLVFLMLDLLDYSFGMKLWKVASIKLIVQYKPTLWWYQQLLWDIYLLFIYVIICLFDLIQNSAIYIRLSLDHDKLT